MPLDRVRVRSVRCVTAADIDLHPQRNYLFGPNGAGKTSLLEAIHVLGRGRSFRTRQTIRLVQRGSSGLAVSGTVTAAPARQRLRVRFQAGRLDVEIDGGGGRSLVDLARILPVHVIDPQLHELIEGGPSARRRYLDTAVFHVEQGYLETWRAYRRALGQRNSALKRQAAPRELEAWNMGLGVAGEAVHAARTRHLEALRPVLTALGIDFLGRELGIDYRPGWPPDMPLGGALAAGIEGDRAAGFTQAGPHRADLVIRLDGSPARDGASRGQQKLMAAALVLAQVRVVGAACPGTMLLVDDPAAELDAPSLERLVTALEEVPAQLVLTGLSPDALPPSPGFPVFHVEQGHVEAVL